MLLSRDKIFNKGCKFYPFVRVHVPLNAIHIASLERIQRRFMKYLSYREDGIYPPIGFSQSALLDRHNLCSVTDTYKMFCVVFVFKLLNNSIDCSEILSKIPFNVCLPRGHRNYDLFYLPTPRTNIGKFSPLANICRYAGSIHRTVDLFCSSLNKIKSVNYSEL